MDGIWEKLRLKAHAVPLRINGSPFPILFFDKIARVELHARKIGIYFHRAPGTIFRKLRHFFQRSGLFIQRVIVVITAGDHEWLVIGPDLLADRLFR